MGWRSPRSRRSERRRGSAGQEFPESRARDRHDAAGAGSRRGCLGKVAARLAAGPGRSPTESVMSLHPAQVLLRPVISEKSYEQITQNKYTFKVHQAVEELFDVTVVRVNIVKVQPKPKRRGLYKGIRPGWKKAIVELKAGDSIEIFEGA